jgi:transcription initiation factor TFIIB
MVIQNNERCPRCTKSKLVTDNTTGEVFCSSCGFVIDDTMVNNSPERMFSDSTVSKSRTGDRTSLTRHDQGLSTIINPSNKDATGKPLSASMKSTVKQLRKLDNRSQTSKNTDKNLKHAMSELLKMKEKLSLPDSVAEKAAYIYRKALEKKLVRGRSISSVIAASLYAACRELGIPRTLNEVSKSENIKKGDLSVCYRMLLKELDMKMPIVNAVTCIAKIASNIGLSEKTKRYATKLLKLAEEKQILAGKDPTGMAASALYLASLNTGENVSQKQVAEAAQITEVTIRNRIKNLRNLD